MNKIIGIDPSLSATGVCVLTFADATLYRIETTEIRTKGKPGENSFMNAVRRGSDSAARIVDWISQRTAFPVPVTCFCIEEAAHGANGHVSSIYAHRVALFQALETIAGEIPIVTLTTTSLKKFATGSGRLASGKEGKAQMEVALGLALGDDKILTSKKTDNEVEAIWLALASHVWYNTQCGEPCMKIGHGVPLANLE